MRFDLIVDLLFCFVFFFFNKTRTLSTTSRHCNAPAAFFSSFTSTFFSTCSPYLSAVPLLISYVQIRIHNNNKQNSLHPLTHSRTLFTSSKLTLVLFLNCACMRSSSPFAFMNCHRILTVFGPNTTAQSASSCFNSSNIAAPSRICGCDAINREKKKTKIKHFFVSHLICNWCILIGICFTKSTKFLGLC